MPLPKDMEKCMRKAKKEYPHGRSKKKMSKSAAHKQRVAMCLDASGQSKVDESQARVSRVMTAAAKGKDVPMAQLKGQAGKAMSRAGKRTSSHSPEIGEWMMGKKKVNEGASLKSLVEGLSFSNFLLTELTGESNTSEVRGYIRSLPQYQELIRDAKTKAAALDLARELATDFQDESPLSPIAQDYIIDAFDDLSRQTFKGRTSVGDWGDERKEEPEDQWEDETEDSDESEDEKSSRRAGGARTGMDYESEKKQRRAKADIEAFADDETADKVVAAKTATASMKREAGASSKTSMARSVFDTLFGKEKPSEIIRTMMQKVGMSKPHATSYYYKFKKESGK